MGTKKLIVKDISIGFISRTEDDYISLTDIAKYKNPSETGLVISHWLSTRFSVEFMGIWEQIHNPNFNTTEFSSIRNQSGSAQHCFVWYDCKSMAGEKS